MERSVKEVITELGLKGWAVLGHSEVTRVVFQSGIWWVEGTGRLLEWNIVNV